LIIGEKIEEDDTEYVRVSRPTKSNISIVEEFNFYASSSPKNLKNNTINNNNLNIGSCLFCFLFRFALIFYYDDFKILNNFKF
jgi:hypothetical protein